jgi:hypothetical protein
LATRSVEYSPGRFLYGSWLRVMVEL